MKLITKHSSLKGTVSIPGSKSHTIRSVALASLARGSSVISSPLNSQDTLAAVNAYRLLGADIAGSKTWMVQGTSGNLQVPNNIIDVENSGTTLRIAAGSAALLDSGIAIFNGDKQIRSRPIGPLLKSLNDLGANCKSSGGNDKAPIIIEGQLKGGFTQIEAVTSQYLTSLLINAPLAKGDTEIEVTLLNEKPYVEITLAYLDEMGIEYQNEDFKRFHIKGGQSYEAFEKRIPADFSSATFFLCAGAFLDADITLEGLDFDDPQGDKAVVDILKEMGANITINNKGVHVSPNQLQGIDIDMNAIPDALPALAVVACFAKGKTRLYNVKQARLKETDRIAVMAQELKRLGAKINEKPDGLEIEPSILHAANLHGHHDHRIVMALSLVGMALTSECTVDTAEAINVTFPDYIQLMHNLGAHIRTCED